jgi:hypothetical protein
MDHSKCKVSTGIYDTTCFDAEGKIINNGPHGLTFGQGELDDYGYWEIPCAQCARKHEKIDNVPVNSYWPWAKLNEKC